MTIAEAQKQVDIWIQTIGVRYFDVMTNNALLMEEVGELSRLFARMYGEQSFKNEISTAEMKDKLGEEMSDVLFVLLCLANQTEIDLTRAFHDKMIKRTQRDEKRHRNNQKLK